MMLNMVNNDSHNDDDEEGDEETVPGVSQVSW